MAENRLAFLKVAFPDYRVDIAEDLRAVIVNPFGGENIEVNYCEEDDYTPFVVCFSFQHRHLSDNEAVVSWIHQIASGKKMAIAFFQNGQRRFGGEIMAENLAAISYEQLELHTGYYGATKLLAVADTFKVRGWNPDSDFDAVFAVGADGAIMIHRVSK